MGIATAGNSRDIQHAERISRDVCGDASNGVVSGVLSEISLPLCEPTPFFLDSQSAEDLAINPVYHKRSKPIEIKYH